MQFANGAHAAAPHNVSGIVVGLCLVFYFSVGIALPIAAALRLRRASRRSLRDCPICSATALRETDAAAIEAMRVRLRLQCGQCGTWREVVAADADVGRLRRVLERDRRLIGDTAERLASRRTRRDLRTFARALESDIVGAEDFIALAQRRET